MENKYKKLNKNGEIKVYISINADGSIWGDNEKRGGEPIMPAIFYTKDVAECLGGKNEGRKIKRCVIKII